MSSTFTSHFDRIHPILNLKKFNIPLNQDKDSYYPDFLTKKLDEWIDYYDSELKSAIDEKITFDRGGKDVILSKIRHLSEKLSNSVSYFFAGNILSATETFNAALNHILFDDLKTSSTIKEGKNFYRARSGDHLQLTKEGLFHIPFEKRHFVSTNRYSVPGFPALYLGDSTYVCWEEFNRHRFRDLWFSRLQNTCDLQVVKIQRIEDFFKEIETVHPNFKLTFLLRFLILFPLTIACTIKVKEHNGHFKPEYIIPQLLLQYVSESKEVDGIMFPSTKVDYSLIKNVESYNYVFPVKTVKKQGFCDVLTNRFIITQPTSLEVEEIIYNPKYQSGIHLGGGSTGPTKSIQLVKNKDSSYSSSSFFRIEQSLISRNLESILP